MKTILTKHQLITFILQDYSTEEVPIMRALIAKTISNEELARLTNMIEIRRGYFTQK
jgi:hypothetical protein